MAFIVYHLDAEDVDIALIEEVVVNVDGINGCLALLLVPENL